MIIVCCRFQRRKEMNMLTGMENEKEIVGEAERLDIKDKAILPMAEVLFDHEILSLIKTYRTLFLRVCMSEAFCSCPCIISAFLCVVIPNK